MPKKTTKKEQDLENLGKKLLELYESGYFNNSKKQVYKTSFVKGILAGLGGAIGATVVLGFAMWGLSQFQRIPLLDPLVDKIINAVESNN